MLPVLSFHLSNETWYRVSFKRSQNWELFLPPVSMGDGIWKYVYSHRVPENQGYIYLRVYLMTNQMFFPSWIVNVLEVVFSYLDKKWVAHSCNPRTSRRLETRSQSGLQRKTVFLKKNCVVLAFSVLVEAQCFRNFFIPISILCNGW